MPPKVLLIVDDQYEVADCLKLILNKMFDSIHLALDHISAEQCLQSQHPPITHIICDNFLGPEQPLGLQLLKKWRNRYPQITFAALLSGSELKDLIQPAEIDSILTKPVSYQVLNRLLG